MTLGPPYIITYNPEKKRHENVSGGSLERMLKLAETTDFMVNGKFVKGCDIILPNEPTEFYPIKK